MNKAFLFLLASILVSCNSKVDKPNISVYNPKTNIPEIKIPKSDIDGKICNYTDSDGAYLGEVFYSLKEISSMQIEHSFDLLKDKNGNKPSSSFLKLSNNEPMMYAHYLKKEDGLYYSKNGVFTTAVFDSESYEVSFLANNIEIATLKDCKDYTQKSSISISLTPYYSTLAKELYPNDKEDQKFVEKFFDILEIHKRSDPFQGKVGPGISGYNLSKIPFAFIVNEQPNTIDLVIFNWPGTQFEGLEKSKRFTGLYSNGDVYLLKDIEKKSIATQGENHDSLSNFSYINGADSMLHRSGVLNYPSISEEIIESMRNWKPHPEYMDRDHPLRVALKENVLTALAPSKKFIFGEEVMNDPDLRQLAFSQFENNSGGFINAILGMMVHEMYHVKEGEVYEDKTEGVEVNADRKKVLEELNDVVTQKLYVAYKNIVFQLGDTLTDKSQIKDELLSDLAFVVKSLKDNHTNAWDFIWEYEYTEGFAEYASAQSMVASLVTSLKEQVKLQKTDSGNNFVYRTGSIAGLYMYYSLKDVPFSNGEHKTMSPWEIILEHENTQASSDDLETIFTKYEVKLDEQNTNEIERVREYLISTVRDL